MINDMIKQANKFQKLTVVFLIALMGMTLVYACGSESDEQLSGNLLQISLSCPDISETARISDTFGVERTLSDIVLLRLTVEDGSPPIVPVVDEFDPQNPDIMIDVPVGSNRMFTIEGLDEDGNVICQGSTITDITPDTVEIDIGCDFVFEICDDGIDNDFDEDIDCSDGDCEDFCMIGDDDDDDVVGNDDDDEPPAREDDTPDGCSDEIDNDGDNFIDCNDNDCLRNIACLERPTQPPPPPSGGGCPMIQGDGGPIPDCNDAACCGFDECNSCTYCEVCDTCNQCFETQLPAFCANPQ